MIRLGLVGLGAMGRRHLDALLGREDSRLAAIADPRADALAAAMAAAAAAEVPLPASFADGAALLEAGGVDAVIVATPPQTHAAICCAAIAAGVAVLVEKPLAATVADGRSIVSCAEGSPVIVQVGHIERFNPAVAALKNCLRDDLAGRVRSIQAVRVATAAARREDVGVTLDHAVHDLDLICHLLGEDPTSVEAVAERDQAFEHEDVVRGKLDFASGVVATVEASWLASSRERRITVTGVRGTLEADLLSREVWFTASDTHVRESLAVPTGDPLHREHDAFISSIHSRGRSPVSVADGLRAVALAQLMLESADVGMA